MNLMNADDPMMQQLGSILSAQHAKNDNLEKRPAAFEKARINQMVRDHEELGFPLSTTIVITWLMYSNRLSCRTSLIVLFVSTTRMSIGVLPSLRSSREHSLFSSNSRSLAGTRYSIVVCVTLISRLFPGNYRLATQP